MLHDDAEMRAALINKVEPLSLTKCSHTERFRKIFRKTRFAKGNRREIVTFDNS